MKAPSTLKASAIGPAFRNDPDMDTEMPVALPPGPNGSAAASAAPVTALDLTNKRKVVLLIGAGRVGKTTLARWIGEAAIAAGEAPILAACDPLNRSLAGYFDNVAQPATNDPAATATWLEALFGHLMANPGNAVIDLGGGDTGLSAVLRSAPDLPDLMEAAGTELVAFYLAGSRIDDLAAVASMEAAGFRPKARAVVLNEALGEASMPREEAFGRVLRHSVYRNAIVSGAVPLWMPRILGNAAAEAENKRLSFAQARDGLVPEGRKVSPLGAFDRSRIRTWLAAMDREFAPVASWLR